MPEILISVIGSVAAFCTTFGLLPQAIRVWKTKETAQLSLGTFSLMLIGAILWLCYGIFRPDIIIVAANLIAIIFIGYIFTAKILSLRKGAGADFNTGGL